MRGTATIVSAPSWNVGVGRIDLHGVRGDLVGEMGPDITDQVPGRFHHDDRGVRSLGEDLEGQIEHQRRLSGLRPPEYGEVVPLVRQPDRGAAAATHDHSWRCRNGWRQR